MKIQCPHCDKIVEIYEFEAGKMTECPACQNLFVPSRRNDSFRDVCPFCNNPLDPGVIVCVNCGYHLQKKGLLETKIEGEEALAPLWKKILFEILALMPGLLKPLHIILFLISLPISFYLVLLGLGLLGFGLLFTAIAVCGCAMMVYIQGVSFIFNDRIEMVNQAFNDFRGMQLTLFLCAAFAPAFIIFILMLIAANGNG